MDRILFELEGPPGTLDLPIVGSRSFHVNELLGRCTVGVIANSVKLREHFLLMSKEELDELLNVHRCVFACGLLCASCAVFVDYSCAAHEQMSSRGGVY